MDVTVENVSTLERRMSVKIPAQEIDSKTEKKLQELSKKVKLDGFRPGKVPLTVVKQRYGESTRQEIVADAIQNSYFETLEKEKLRPAGQPHIDPKPSKEGEALEYTATFEVYPTVELNSLQDVAVDKVTAKIAEVDIDKMVEKLQKQQAEWKETERAGKNGDQLIVDFEGKIKGEVFQGGTAKDFKLELGAGAMLPDFEKPLVGAKAGDVIKVKMKFPKDYGSEDVAGKKVEFEVKVHKVLEQALPELNAKFLKKMGIEKGGVTALREKVKTNMEQQLTQAVDKKLKDVILDKFLELNPIELPKVLLDDEIKRLQEQAKQQFMQYTRGNVKDIPDMPRAEFEENAKKRVSLGLLLSKMVEQENLKADPAKVKAKLEAMAAGYKNPQEVVDWYYENREYMAEIESLILEEDVYKKLQDQVKIAEKVVGYEEVVNA